jgi:hypothetical protein
VLLADALLRRWLTENNSATDDAEQTRRRP